MRKECIVSLKLTEVKLWGQGGKFQIDENLEKFRSSESTGGHHKLGLGSEQLNVCNILGGEWC